MAELILKVGTDAPGDHAHYQDGDILCAFNRRYIRCVHAQVICHPRKAITRDGLRPSGGVSEAFFAATHQYKMERISRTEVRRTNLHNVLELPEVLSAAPNANGEYMNVALYVESRLKHPGHKIYGTPGREVWYGGAKRFSHTEMDVVWTSIESKTPLREVDHQRSPLTPLEKRAFLSLAVDDFDDVETARLMHTTTSERKVGGETFTDITHKRKSLVDWRNLSELSSDTKTRVDDPNEEVDNRHAAPLTRAAIVETKP